MLAWLSLSKVLRAQADSRDGRSGLWRQTQGGEAFSR